MTTATCSDEEMSELIAAIGSSSDDGIALVERAITHYPNDARLHFLRGSLLIGVRRPIEAHAALSRAVALAPEFALARFQLGFFELTSGEAQRALATWEPLDTLPDDHYLAHFIVGLRHLIHDRFEDAIAALQAGIALNSENMPLNHDMTLIVDQCRIATNNATERAGAADETSATSFLLGQLGGRGTTH